MKKNILNLHIFAAAIVLGLFATPQLANAVPSVTQTQPTAGVVLYTYTSECAARILPPSASTLSKEVAVAVPNNRTDVGNTYIYFHGNDHPTITNLCNGGT